jgi:hypothetical protein
MAGFEILKVGIVQTSEALVVFIHTTDEFFWNPESPFYLGGV